MSRLRGPIWPRRTALGAVLVASLAVLSSRDVVTAPSAATSDPIDDTAPAGADAGE